MYRNLLSAYATGLLFAAVTSTAYAQDVKSINFGIISTESSQNLKAEEKKAKLDDIARKLSDITKS